MRVSFVYSQPSPQLQADSPTSRMCNAICDQLKGHDEAEVRLQSVQNRQMLVLFAPHTIDVASLQPMLKEQLNSTHVRDMQIQTCVACLCMCVCATYLLCRTVQFV